MTTTAGLPVAHAEGTPRHGTGPPVHALTQHLGYLLRLAFVLSTDCAKACITDDVDLREVALLALLAERAPLSQRQVGELLHVNRSMMVKLVDTMEAKGLVVRERNVADRRSYALRLTDRGETVRAELLGELNQGDNDLTARLALDERAELNAALTALLDNPELTPIASLSQHCGYLIAQSHRLYRAKALERLAPLGLDPRDFGVLSVVAHQQPCSQNQLAGCLGISPPGAFACLEDLEVRGFVRRERSDSDRRVHQVRLTAKGQRRLKAARAAAAELDSELVSMLGARRHEQLIRLLGKLVDELAPAWTKALPVR